MAENPHPTVKSFGPTSTARLRAVKVQRLDNLLCMISTLTLFELLSSKLSRLGDQVRTS